MPPPIPDAVARTLWETSDLAIVVSSGRGVTFVNQGFTRLTGLEADEVLGLPLTALTRPRTEAGRLAAGEDASAEAHVRLLVAKGGGHIEVGQTVRTIDVDGERFAISTFARMDDRERLADALAASERDSIDLFEEETGGRFSATPDWRLIGCNTMLARMLGAAAGADLVGRALSELVLDEPLLQKLLAVTRVERRAGPAALQLERADGGVIDVLCSIAGTMDESGGLVLVRGLIVEITGSKQLETRLAGAERMEVIGRLAGGLAHDFNNLLTVISGNSERLLEGLPEQGALRSAATAIHEATLRAASLTRQLLAYGRRQVFALEPRALPQIVADARPLLTAILGEGVALDVAADRDQPAVSVDARQITHVLEILAMNAREAMPSGGTLRIAADAVDVDDRLLKERRWLRPGRYGRLTVSDTGRGMDPVTRAHAFQPFFTTKKMGDGRGLGLATVYGIVKQSRGFVWVDSEVGQGARFTLLFPALVANSPNRPSSGAPPATETILLVEEDAGARASARDALERRGYHVLEAETAAGALDVFASHPGRVHLVLADVEAVTADGVPLAARLRAIDPMVQSLAMLGIGHDQAGGSRVLSTTPAIQKPFTLHAFAAKVRAVLDSGEGR